MHVTKETRSIILVCMYARIIIIAASCTVTLNLQASLTSFDNYFSKSWYEKGLSSAIFVWNKVCLLLINNKCEEISAREMDIVLGKCAFARFCLEKMVQNNQQLLEEDIIYFAALLHNIDRMIDDNNDGIMTADDRISCMQHMLAAMKKQLQIPCNI